MEGNGLLGCELAYTTAEFFRRGGLVCDGAIPGAWPAPILPRDCLGESGIIRCG
jgi:hypothetical protein